jgi:hypothetical protein
MGDYRRDLHLSERPGQLSLANEFGRIVAHGVTGLEIRDRPPHPLSKSESLEQPFVGPGADVAIWRFGVPSLCSVLTSLGQD